jgi:RNA polymerase sigma-70 factor, ECF subfamily
MGSAAVSPPVLGVATTLAEGLTALRTSLRDLLNSPMYHVMSRGRLSGRIRGTATVPAPLPLSQLDTVRIEDTAQQPTVRLPDPRTPPPPDPDSAAGQVLRLIERAQNGDVEAFGELYDRYVDIVYRFVFFRTGHKELSEDITSETFLRAMKRIGSFTWQGRDIGAWLVTIARNQLADHYKSARYRLEVTVDQIHDGVDRAADGLEAHPEKAVVDHVTNVALLTAVQQLNPRQQEVITLRFLMGFSVAETAEAMSKKEGAVKAMQYRAIKSLARLLPEGFEP